MKDTRVMLFVPAIATAEGGEDPLRGQLGNETLASCLMAAEVWKCGFNHFSYHLQEPWPTAIVMVGGPVYTPDAKEKDKEKINPPQRMLEEIQPRRIFSSAPVMALLANDPEPLTQVGALVKEIISSHRQVSKIVTIAPLDRIPVYEEFLRSDLAGANLSKVVLAHKPNDPRIKTRMRVGTGPRPSPLFDYTLN